jgi:hypothetical protein
MIISLVLDQSRLWRWHLTLIQQLEVERGARVVAIFSSATHPLDPALVFALRLEAAISRGSETKPFDPLTLSDFSPWIVSAIATPDLIIDLASLSAPLPKMHRVMLPLFNGQIGEPAFWQQLLEGKAPLLSILDTEQSVIAIGQPGIESPHALQASASRVVTRLITGLVRAATVLQNPNAEPAQAPKLKPSHQSIGSTAALLARKVTIKAQRVIDQTLGTAPQWAVAWRTHDTPPSPLSYGEFDPAAFTLLPDDGARYYADPFLFANGSDIHMFVEELPYATNRGIISVTTRRADGTFPTPHPVLETPFHLSYPHVFARDGEIWMLPEQSASGGLTLYRATDFPDIWEPVVQLIDEPLHDATLFEHDGMLWIAANTQGPQTARWGSSWDSLSLYSAPKLLSPWTPHRDNPVLIDAATTRSAGAAFEAGGKVYRPVQDCSTGYGVALGFAEINILTSTTYAQRLVSRISFPANSGIVGPHTLNQCSVGKTFIEAIDLFGTTKTIRSTFKPATSRR